MLESICANDGNADKKYCVIEVNPDNEERLGALGNALALTASPQYF